MGWETGLEGPAKGIVASTHSPLRILAGPGTGKTFAMMRRVSRLLSEGVDPASILVCTFTRTSAHDLVKELNKLGDERATDVTAGTLHSLCFRILSQDDVLEVTGRTPRPLLSHEMRFLLEDLRSQEHGDIKTVRSKLQAYEAAWARLPSDRPGTPTDPSDVKFHTDLESWLRRHKAMLIGELIPLTLRYLGTNPLSPHIEAYAHVLVDEYQDLNRAEQELINRLSLNASLFIVGDENQSIYSFRHAHPEGISTFAADHDSVADYQLLECRRCPSNVVSIANALIANNPNGLEAQLKPVAANPEGEVHLVQWQTLDRQVVGIADIIIHYVHNNRANPGEILVLTPRRQIGYAVRNELIRRGIASKSFFHEEALDGDPKDLERSQAQRAFTLLRLLVNPEDIVSLRCWVGFGHSSLGTNSWKKVEQLARERSEQVVDVLSGVKGRHIRFNGSERVASALHQLEVRLQELSELSGARLVEALFPYCEDWSHPLIEIAATIEKEDFCAAHLLETLVGGITQPEIPTDVPYIRIMSLHKAKGLSATIVFVVGCNEGMIPFIDDHSSIAAQELALEEQRRLFYVAVTRTRRVLILSSMAKVSLGQARQMRVHHRSSSGKQYRPAITSRFITELGPTCPEVKSGEVFVESLMLENK